jgi:hypothetical protein
MVRAAIHPPKSHTDKKYFSGHKHNYERTFPVRNNTLLTTSYRNPPSFFQVITGNAGNYEGPDKFDLTAAVPDWLGKRYQGYGYSAFRVTRSTLDLHHYQTTEQSQTGKLMDHVVVTKSESRIHKQMLLK